MAARRGKSQAKRNGGDSNPAWIWLFAGLALGIALIVGVPKLWPKGDGDGFFRPKPNPDAQPKSTVSADEDDAIVPEPAPAAAKADKPKETQYDFYTLLPSNEVALSDAELAETERAEAERQAKGPQAAAQAIDAANPATSDAASQAPTTSVATAATSTPAKSDAKPAQDDGTKYLLQAGAFQASGDAEAVKAKIALLGLTARVESAQIADKTVYRVRMGPYGSASELADAKRRLGGGGLPALAIKAR
jgi:cell division protein FtsN